MCSPPHRCKVRSSCAALVSESVQERASEGESECGGVGLCNPAIVRPSGRKLSIFMRRTQLTLLSIAGLCSHFASAAANLLRLWLQPSLRVVVCGGAGTRFSQQVPHPSTPLARSRWMSVWVWSYAKMRWWVCARPGKRGVPVGTGMQHDRGGPSSRVAVAVAVQLQELISHVRP